MTKYLGDTAVVVGAGIGGMMAAGILAKYFTQVLVLDKDTLPTTYEVRKSLPQDAHAHTLLVQGRRNLEKIFPSITAKLIERGAVRSRFGTEFLTRDGAGWHPKIDLELPVLTMTRPLLDRTVRQCPEQIDRIVMRQNVRVEGWDFQDDTVVGVVVKGEDGQETIRADFVIDGTGRGGKSLAWLAAGGYGPIEETTIEIGSGYASALYKNPQVWNSQVHSLTIRNHPPNSRGGFIFSVENGCWIVSLIGRFDHQPPSDPDDFEAFAESLCDPILAEWMRRGERVTPIKTYKAPWSRWRHYDRMARFPQRLLPVGDALAHANPLFGQGMSLASTHVINLWECLDRRVAEGSNLDGLADDYFEKVQGFTAGVWQGLENVEFGFPGTKGDRPSNIDDRMAYARGLRLLIKKDRDVHKLLMEVSHLILPGDVLQQPRIKFRVLKIIQDRF